MRSTSFIIISSTPRCPLRVGSWLILKKYKLLLDFIPRRLKTIYNDVIQVVDITTDFPIAIIVMFL